MGHTSCPMRHGLWPPNGLGQGHGPGDFGARARGPLRHDVACRLSMFHGPVLCPVALSHVLLLWSGSEHDAQRATVPNP